MSARGALAIAILVECFVALAGWYLRIRGYRGFPVLVGLHLPAAAFYLWVFMRYFRDPPSRHRPMPRDAWLALIIVASIAVVPLGGFVEKGDWASSFRFMAILPVVLLEEELFFRGILQASMERVMHPAAAILLANVGFIAAHAPVMEINALSISIIGAAGIVLGVVYNVTRSITLVTALHIAGDWVLVLPVPAILGEGTVVAANAVISVAALGWWFSRRERAARPAGSL
jgi:membrane protease YdiL (CAAX protease family)